MKQAPDHLVDLIEPIVEGLGYECVGIEYNPHPQHGLLRIYIDSENGILVDDCSKVSHQVSGVLDVEDPIQGNYQLEVSSPGEDRPLFKLGQFQHFTGSTVTVNLFSAVEKRKKIIKRAQCPSFCRNIPKTTAFPAALRAFKIRIIPEPQITSGNPFPEDQIFPG